LWGDVNFARLFGVERESIGAAPIASYLATIHPDDREAVSRRIDHALKTGEPYTAEYRIQQDHGSRWVIARGKVERDATGRPVRFPGVVLDVTKRKAAEQRLRLAQEVAGIGTFEWNVRTGINTWSPELETLYGLPEGSFAGTFEAWAKTLHPDDLALAVRKVEESLATGSLAAEFRIVRPDGTVRWMEARGQVFRDAAGQPERMIGVNLDVTERKALQVEREALLEAEQAARTRAEVESRLKDEFLATLSHELRTPLSAILGWAQLLSRGSLRDEAKRQQGVTAIERNARTQARLIEDLLDMSRIVSGKVHLMVQQAPLAELVNTALATVQPSAEARGVRLEKRLDPRVGAVAGDPDRLQQVIWNLLSNAVKFTPRGGKVEVVLERMSSLVELRVTDTGEGIDPAFLPHVFDRFRQADGTTTRKHGGLGLGLSIVRHLVELHGGSVRAESAGRGRGATFIVSLPVGLPLGEVPEPTRVRAPRSDALGGAPAAALGASPLEGVRILLVDDDGDGRELARRVLEERGAIVCEAESSEKALELLPSFHPNVLVSDIGMPGGDGYSLIRRVRALAKADGGNVPALALTAFARPEDRKRALATGFHQHLTKPMNPEELVSSVAALASATK
jgi:PAS domain S-box-containing protein